MVYISEKVWEPLLSTVLIQLNSLETWSGLPHVPVNASMLGVQRKVKCGSYLQEVNSLEGEKACKHSSKSHMQDLSKALWESRGGSRGAIWKQKPQMGCLTNDSSWGQLENSSTNIDLRWPENIMSNPWALTAALLERSLASWPPYTPFLCLLFLDESWCML